MKVVVIGGVAGGAPAAARIRRLDESAEIIIIERTPNISYATCGLPYYVGGIIEDPAELVVATPKSFLARLRIEARVSSEATAIDTSAKTVTVKNLITGEVYTETYDKLVLAPGATPTVPKLPGIDGPRIFTLRTVEDGLKMRKFCEDEKPKTALVVGGGFIGIEVAENLAHLGISVTMIQRPKQLLKIVDPDMAELLHTEMKKHGVELLLGANVLGFSPVGEAVRTDVADADPVIADMVVLAIGVTPDTKLAAEAGLSLGARGSIITNEHMETSAPDVYAVGDAVSVRHFITGEPALISLAGPANKQGRIAADNICGIKSRYRGSMGTSVIKVFDLTCASVGLSEAMAAAAGLDFDRVKLTPASHAGYYPGAETMTMKVIFEKSSARILGAAIVGKGGVDKRIDVIATAISAGLSGIDLKDLELAYAPPFSSVKDPVNVAGFMIENVCSKLVKQFCSEELEALPRDGSVTLLDVRTKREFSKGGIPGFINIPVDSLRERLGELSKSVPVYILCHSGLRSYLACRILTQNGFEVFNFGGGYSCYSRSCGASEPSGRPTHCGVVSPAK